MWLVGSGVGVKIRIRIRMWVRARVRMGCRCRCGCGCGCGADAGADTGDVQTCRVHPDWFGEASSEWVDENLQGRVRSKQGNERINDGDGGDMIIAIMKIIIMVMMMKMTMMIMR